MVLLAIVAFMVYDFYGGNQAPEENPYAYELDTWKEVAPELISYREVQQIPVDIEVLRALALDTEDNIYVSGKDQLLIFDRSGELIRKINIGKQIFAMTISEEGIIYLASRDQISLFQKDGSLIDIWMIEAEKTILTGLAVDEQYLYAADAGNIVIYQFNLQGEKIREIGKKDEVQGIVGFVIPSPYFDLAIGRDGELWAANTGRHQLESYDEEGNLISSWKKSSMELIGFSGCCNPSHFAFLSNGNFVTSEKGIERIKVLSPSGDFLSVVAPPTSFEKGTKGIDLAVDSEDRIISIDPKKKLIRIFVAKNDEDVQ